MIKSLIIVDCQNDFIFGDLACKNGEKAVNSIVDFINKNEDLKVFYSLDCHSLKNRSFKINGGVWPVHCVYNTNGYKIHEKFYKNIINKQKRCSNKDILFLKGRDDCKEEYSAYYSKNIHAKTLNEITQKQVIICGIATEFCIKQTVLDFLKHGYKVKVYINGLGYIDEKTHLKTLNELYSKGVGFIKD